MDQNKQLKNVQFTMINITYRFNQYYILYMYEGDIVTTIIFVYRPKYYHVIFFTPLNKRQKINI